jgi:hypothetical protein
MDGFDRDDVPQQYNGSGNARNERNLSPLSKESKEST